MAATDTLRPEAKCPDSCGKLQAPCGEPQCTPCGDCTEDTSTTATSRPEAKCPDFCGKLQAPCGEPQCAPCGYPNCRPHVAGASALPASLLFMFMVMAPCA